MVVSEIGNVPAPFASAIFLLIAMVLAGLVHVIWLRSSYSKHFLQPLDRGKKWRGHRLFGENKLVRGFMAMPPAAALSFGLIAAGRNWFPEWLVRGMWDMSAPGYSLLGFICGLVFMISELPNSFVKRQLDIPPGETPRQKSLIPVFFIVDRLDSVLGTLLVISVFLPTHPMMWVWVIFLGAVIHAAFSTLLHAVGEKKRAL
jgi:hypothetical protein